MIAEFRCTDNYHRVLYYTPHAHTQELLDFSNGIKPEELSISWQTKVSIRFYPFTYNNWIVWNWIGEKRFSTLYELFSSQVAPYFFE